MKLSGIDVSNWQGDINWQKAKASGQVEFVIIRAGYGDALTYPKQKDTKFERNYSECKRLGIPVGAYWYAYATTPEAARQEARACIAALKGKQFEYPILYDVEELRIFKTGRTNEIIKAFCDEMEAAGYWVGIYIYRSAAQSYLSEQTRTRYTMAIAEYASQLHYSGEYGFWQNSSTWRVDGISGNVDHDWCYKDYPTRIKEKGLNGFPKPSAEFRIETIAETDILMGTSTADKPPVQACIGAGKQYTIDKTVTIDGQTFGKIKENAEKTSRYRWVNLKTCKRV